MPALPNAVLEQRLYALLPPGTVINGNTQLRPLDVSLPTGSRFLLHLWTLTKDYSAAGKRPPDEYKIQLIMPGQAPGSRGSLAFVGGSHTVLLGYSPEFGVYVAWEARFYTDFSYSMMVPVRESLLAEAASHGWAVDHRTKTGGVPEVRVAFVPSRLLSFLSLDAQADAAGLAGEHRELHMLQGGAPVGAPQPGMTLAAHVDAERARISATRLERDRRFAAAVRQQFGSACAVCGLQLGVVEGAHIVSVADQGSDDEWNGISMCPNHHRLYDAGMFVVRPDLVIAADLAVRDYLVETSQVQGYDAVSDFAGKPINAPQGWGDPQYRAQMQKCLEFSCRSRGQ